MKYSARFGLVFLALTLAACEDGSVRDSLGLNRDAPDEFTVVSRPPLSLPPEFSLQPPRPGEPPRGPVADQKARALLTGKSPAAETESGKAVAMPSDAASRLLKRAGADSADETIRTKLGEDAVKPADTKNAKTLMEQLSGAEKNEPVVDAEKEAERLRANKDANKPITEGEVPEADTKPRALIDRIF